MSLRDQCSVAIVTGGGRGLGRVFATALANAGMKVAIVARSEDQLRETAEAIRQAGGIALPIAADVADRASVEHAIARAEKELGPADLLVNNAGIIHPLGTVADADPDAWWRCMEVNMRGTLLCTHAVLPGMMERRRGRIINIASGAGVIASPAQSAYVVSKTAVIRFSECLALEVREHGISVFAIEPGTVRTAMTEGILGSPAATKWMPWLTRLFAEHRDVPPQRAAELVLRLASGEADALSGCFLVVSDDLSALLANAEQVRQNASHTLRLRV
jgi:NAD(P)-dependent dehydrogenase (short-subunit alcohol dehydrogenase family)